ncbi:hypothetical protein ZWY2020_005958 [Hordeum vulgare]|nr:hypothetical protein ZWY2020_005958 [Hordeum vulgare]
MEMIFLSKENENFLRQHCLPFQYELFPDEVLMLTLLERINPDHGATFTVLRCLRSACTNISKNSISSQ